VRSLKANGLNQIVLSMTEKIRIPYCKVRIRPIDVAYFCYSLVCMH
jgi:hypothetical protein